jgi:hypothetical protein
MKKFWSYAAFCLLAVPFIAKGQTYNTLTKSERDSGFVLLFDGKTVDDKIFKSFNPYRGQVNHANLYVQNGEMIKHGAVGDFMIDSDFTDFVVKFSFKVPAGGNGGFMYRALKASYASDGGLEYQILDQSVIQDNSTGACYGIYTPSPYPWHKLVWNDARIVANGDKVQHYLNDTMVVSYDMSTQDYKTRLAKSKFNGFMPTDPTTNQQVPFGTTHHGVFVIQDYGSAEINTTWWRDIKVARLPIKTVAAKRLATPSRTGAIASGIRYNGAILSFLPAGALPSGTAGFSAAGRSLPALIVGSGK